MRRYGLLSALMLLLLVNGIVLGGVYYNRSGSAEASLILTERELPLAYSYRHKENSGVSLSLNWNRYNSNLDWFDEAKVLELGFDKKEVEAAESSYRYYNILPIKAFVVLEYAGDAWLAHREKQQDELNMLPIQVSEGKMKEEAAERRKKELENSIRLASRLFAVDVGHDPQVLRNRYPQRDKHLILPAKVRASVRWEDKPGESKRVHLLKGHIDQILIQTLYVPQQYHDYLYELPSTERLHSGGYYYGSESKQRAHYQVALNVGQRYEPWIADIVAIED